MALLALVFVAAALVGLPILRPQLTEDMAAIATPGVRPSPTGAAARPTLALQPTPSQSIAISAPTPSPETTPEPTAAPTAALTPRPTARPTPRPTARPTPTPTLRPPPEQASVRIEDSAFVGAYNDASRRRYQGRTVSWVYGQGTQYHTMTAKFRLQRASEYGRRASLTLVGLDGGDEGKSRVAVVLNGTTIFRGPNPLPNDQCCDGSSSVEWGTAVVRLPGELLRRNNELSIVNLDPSDCTLCSTFVMIDYAELEYRYRP